MGSDFREQKSDANKRTHQVCCHIRVVREQVPALKMAGILSMALPVKSFGVKALNYGENNSHESRGKVESSQTSRNSCHVVTASCSSTEASVFKGC